MIVLSHTTERLLPVLRLQKAVGPAVIQTSGPVPEHTGTGTLLVPLPVPVQFPPVCTCTLYRYYFMVVCKFENTGNRFLFNINEKFIFIFFL